MMLAGVYFNEIDAWRCMWLRSQRPSPSFQDRDLSA
jgi:hypothetical protein